MCASTTYAADAQILLPLGRTAYQTNEWIDVSIIRSEPRGPLAESTLTLWYQSHLIVGLADGRVMAFEVK